MPTCRNKKIKFAVKFNGPAQDRNLDCTLHNNKNKTSEKTNLISARL